MKKRNILALSLCIMIAIGLMPLSALAANDPFRLENPANLRAELKWDADGQPYFELKLDVPQSVRALNDKIIADYAAIDGIICDQVYVEFDYKYADYDWNEGPSHVWTTTAYLTDFLDLGYFEYRPFDSSKKYDEVDIKSETYHFRARFYVVWGYVGDFISEYTFSGYSNTVTIGNPAYWSAASSWATPELKQAAEAGLVPDILKGADMTRPITREEFCELAILLYEKCTGETVEVPANPFTDTSNPQILKAFAIGITTGTSLTTFSPNELITREQCATMLFRAIKAINPDGDYSTAGEKDFADQKHISSWAVEATKYMAKIGIITGNTAGEFMPKATTTVQKAAGYGMATREQAIAMSIRTYNKLGK